jgi:hypothetical protein
MNCEIIAIGSELLTPFRTDTNSLFLTERLNKLGVQVAFKSIVGDRQQDLVDQVRIARPSTTSPAKPSPKPSACASSATRPSSARSTPASPPAASP